MQEPVEPAALQQYCACIFFFQISRRNYSSKKCKVNFLTHLLLLQWDLYMYD
jgi:hypothetical protein